MSPAQYLLTVTAPMLATGREGRLLAERVNRNLERLGNPASPEIRAKLDAKCSIHFMSICAITPTMPNEPATLIIEATGDGDRLAVIRAIDRSLGDDLYPILSRACGLADRGEIAGWMRKHSKRLSGRTPIGRRISGRTFAGIEDFTVPEILGHAKIAQKVRDEVLNCSGKPTMPHRPIEIIDRARSAVTDPKLKALIDQRLGKPAPSFVDRPDSPWIKAQVSRLQNRLISQRVTKAAQFVRSLPIIIWAIALVLYLISFVTIFAALTDDNTRFADSALIRSALNLRSPDLISSLFLALLPAIVSAIGLIALFMIMLRRVEKANTPDDSDPDPDIVAELLRRENPPNRPKSGQWTQNHMIAVTELQGGFFRRFIVLPFALRLLKRRINLGTSRKGYLRDMGTVHFARWLVPPGTNKFVFFSNYDGSWESYFEDFIIKVADGVTAAWSSSKGFPKTRLMLSQGATDGDRFKRFARRAMIPTPFWYAAYPELTAEQIRKNGLLVHGLANVRSASHAQAWISMHGSRPRPDFDVEHEEIQSLAFSGLSSLTKSRVYALRFTDISAVDPGEKGATKRDRTKKWLQTVFENRLNFGRTKPASTAHCLGLSISGLEKLGLRTKLERSVGKEQNAAIEIDGLPGAFVHGMHHPGRNRALKDPIAENWEWGGKGTEVDAVLLTYWEDGPTGDRLHSGLISEFASYGIEVVKQIETQLNFYDGKKLLAKEPFGFADGVSQPKIRGITRHGEQPESVHDVEAGEFILGYRDNLGYFPSTPTVSRSDDLSSLLPSEPKELPLRWPEFGGKLDRESNRRDFGRNGTFLVIRQLYQNVDKFDNFVKSYTSNSSANSAAPDAEWIKSRMFGRWPNGSSTVLNPHQPGKMDTKEHIRREGEFLFGEEDPQGKSCPLGAHIRRANPRDSFNPHDPHELSVSNRHRLLRRGRSYDITFDNGRREKGTMFICLNANIERQFEFIQQTWLNSESFHGLRDERDPIAASSGGPADNNSANNPSSNQFNFSIPTNTVTHQVCGLSAFVELRGGGYFFMPSRRSIEFLCYL